MDMEDENSEGLSLVQERESNNISVSIIREDAPAGMFFKPLHSVLVLSIIICEPILVIICLYIYIYISA